MNTIEVLIPVRDPTEVFGKTAESLISQTDKDFSILISDNYSTKGVEHMERAMATLQAAGIQARKIQPPTEMERVEHWNWLHYQSSAQWLKPLFAGDWLEPGYIATLRETIAREKRCAYVYCGYQYHSGEDTRVVLPQWGGRHFSPKQMQDVVLRFGMQFGPPSVASYERTAFRALGGYPTALPIAADSLFFCTFAARFGAVGIQKPLCHFNIHASRFSTTLPGRRRDTLRETFTYYLMLAYHGWTEHDPVPLFGFLRLLVRTVREHLSGR